MPFNPNGEGQDQANIVVGTAGNDIMFNTDFWEFLQGGAGNDAFIASATAGWYPDYADQFNGGSGTDVAQFTNSTLAVDVDLTDGVAWRKDGGDLTGPIGLISIENVVGSVFNDTIRGDGLANVLHGHDGNDWLHGEGGNDTLWGGQGNDTVLGGNGHDTLHGENGNDNLDGGGDNDLLYGGDGNDMLKGSAGNDTLEGGAGNDALNGGSGIDTAVYNTAGNVQVNLGVGIATGALGWDTLLAIENVTAGGGHDVVVGSSAANRLEGGGGNDSINGSDGNDHLLGGTGNDTINGGNDNDFIDGGSNNDTLNGDGGNDSVLGGSGNDTVSGGSGNDTVNGGSGINTVRGGSGNDTIFVDLGTDTIRWNVGDLGLDQVVGFQLGQDKVQFGAGFLAGDLEESLMVFNSGAGSLLMAETAEAGWEAIATFANISAASLETAIDNGVLFGFQPVFDGPGGVIV